MISITTSSSIRVNPASDSVEAPFCHQGHIGAAIGRLVGLKVAFPSNFNRWG